MALVQGRKYCRTCQAETLHGREDFSFEWGCLFTIVTLGLFFFPWIIIAAIDAFRPWRCQTCGSTTQFGTKPKQSKPVPPPPPSPAAPSTPIARKFVVRGVDKDSGFETELVVEATTEVNARAKSELKGMVVTEVARPPGPRFKVRGIDRESGQLVEVAVDAETVKDAATKAKAKWGSGTDEHNFD